MPDGKAKDAALAAVAAKESEGSEAEKELEKLCKHSSKTSFSDFYHLEDADAAVQYVEVEP